MEYEIHKDKKRINNKAHLDVGDNNDADGDPVLKEKFQDLMLYIKNADGGGKDDSACVTFERKQGLRNEKRR